MEDSTVRAPDAAGRMEALARASREFSAATADYQKLLDVVARTVGELLGELCSIRLVSDDGEWLRADDASIHHPDPAVVATFRQAMQRVPLRVGEGLAGSVAQSGEPLVLAVPEAQDLAPLTIPSYRALLQVFDAASLMLLPLLSHGKCLGVLSLSRRRGARPYDDEDLHLGRDLADRAALAFENCGLLTDLARRVAELGKEEEKFRQLLESAPDGIVMLDSDHRIVLLNARTEELFGYARNELLGRSLASLLDDASQGQASTPLSERLASQVFDGSGRAALELSARCKDGRTLPVELNLSRIQTQEGPRVTAVMRDVSERKRLEEARARATELEAEKATALEASRLKSEFLASMSHELRTPLNAIIGFSALLHAGKAGPLTETQTEYLGDVLNSSRHLLQLINDVLDLAKVEAGRLEVRPELLDLPQLVAEVRDTLRGLAAEKQLNVRCSVSERLPPVHADARLLKQVLYNLMSNAIKFTPASGSIEVALRPHGTARFVLAVKDTGIGIKPEDIGRLFREFQQLDNGDAKAYAGTGLGLALTKRLVEAQGGSVRAESSPGHGSTFEVDLPLSYGPREP